MDDAFLARQVLTGNREAFRLLVLRYERPLFRFLGLLGLQAAAAEDLAQETFLRAYRALGSYEPERAKFSSWLFTIAKRLAINERRRASHRLEAPLTAEDEPMADAPDPGARERAVRVARALGDLPEPLRSTFVLAQVRELSLEEVARLEGCAVGTVKSRVFRARERLRHALSGEGEEQ